MPPEFEQMIKANSGRVSAIARYYADAEEQGDLYQADLVKSLNSSGAAAPRSESVANAA